MNKEEIDYWLKLFIDNNYAFMSKDGKKITLFKVFDELKKLQQENQELKEKLNKYEDPEDLTLMFMYCDEKAKDKIKNLEKQLKYLRSGEYLNQLRFEINMLENVVANGEVSKEDKEFIDMTHRNTELLEQQKEFIKYLEDEKDRLVRGCSNVYEDSLGKTRFVNEDIFNEVHTILSKYKEIIGE